MIRYCPDARGGWFEIIVLVNPIDLAGSIRYLRFVVRRRKHRVKSAYFIGIAILSLLLIGFGCGSDDEDDEQECPKFDSYQIYPDVGTSDSQYELLVVLKNSSVNRDIERIEAALYHSDGSNAQKVWDLVQSSSDPYRYLSNTFEGSEVCEEGYCYLYFQVIAHHDSGCIRGFDSDVFVVEATEPAPGDDDDDDDAS
jgi:hypothetical protein